MYVTTGDGSIFRPVPRPILATREALIRLVSEQVGRVLESRGQLVRDLRFKLSDVGLGG